MGAHRQSVSPVTNRKYRRLLWVALLVNAGMWLLEKEETDATNQLKSSSFT